MAAIINKHIVMEKKATKIIMMTIMKEAQVLMTISLKMMMIKWRTQIKKVTIKTNNKEEVMKILKKKNLQEKNVSIDCAILKRFIKNCAQKLNMPNTDFSVDNAMIAITITIFVNFASKFTPVLQIQMMMINGLDVTLAIVG